MLNLLSSSRFWGLILASASAVLADPSFPTQTWYISLAKFLGLLSAGAVTVRTIDRQVDKKIEAGQ